MSKNYNRNDRYDKYSELNDDFEDYGYDVKNVRRQTKKKVTKFKTKDDDYYDSFWTGTVTLPLPPRWDIVHESSGIHMKTIRIQVETYDGCTTIWYEKSKLKNPTEVICNRVNKQLGGLNIKRIDVSLSPATVWQFSKCPRGLAIAPDIVHTT